MSEIYSPEQDSFLLSEVLEQQIPFLIKENKNLKVLEIGIGSGIQLQALKKCGVKNIFGVDINSEAVEFCKKLGFGCVKSNLFENIKGKFDLIIFNPPYLPNEEKEPETSKLITTGGKKGGELINKFLFQARKHLNKNGRIFLITSSLTKGINWQDFQKKILAKKKIFFEELYCLELGLK